MEKKTYILGKIEIYSLYGVFHLNTIPFTSSKEINEAENITPIGLLHASKATGIPLNPIAGKL